MARISLVERLAPRKSWQNALLAVGACITALLLIAFVAHLCYSAFPPSAWSLIVAFHILLSGMAGWFIPKPFVEAIMLHHFQDEVNRIQNLEDSK
jgi:hypothetical protein